MSKRSRGQAMLEASRLAPVEEKADQRSQQRRRRTPSQPVESQNTTALVPDADTLDIDKQKSRMQSLQGKIDLLLNECQRKGRVATWSMLKDGAERLLDSRVTIDDLVTLLTVDPSAYVLSWQSVVSEDGGARSQELCLAFSKSAVGKSLSTESRMKDFRRVREDLFGILSYTNYCVFLHFQRVVGSLVQGKSKEGARR
jgi:hypothetical protein